MKKIVNKYIFFDRDGTLIYEPQDSYQIDEVSKLRLLPGVIRSLQRLQKRGFKFIMVSNQDGLGTASFPTEKFNAVQNRLLNIFSQNGIAFDQLYICPHFSSDRCNCRKPKTGLVDIFLQKNQIDKTSSFVCGDRKSDQEFSRNIGVSFIPINTNGNLYTAIQKAKGVLI